MTLPPFKIKSLYLKKRFLFIYKNLKPNTNVTYEKN